MASMAWRRDSSPSCSWMLWKYCGPRMYSLGFFLSRGSACWLISACSSRREAQNASQPWPHSSEVRRRLGKRSSTPDPMSAAMLRWAFHTWLAERTRNMLSQLSHMPGGYGTDIVKEWITTVRSCSWAAAQIGSQSGSSSVIPGGQTGKMPTGHLSLPQRLISATDADPARTETCSTLVGRAGDGAQ